MKQKILLFAIISILLSACSSDEPEPTYNWFVIISCDEYKYNEAKELVRVREIRHDEKYVLNKTESYIKEECAKYDNVRIKDGDKVYIYSYYYRKVDSIKI